MKKINNNFKINTLIAKHIENKFLNFKFFLKDIENTKIMQIHQIKKSLLIVIFFLKNYFILQFSP